MDSVNIIVAETPEGLRQEKILVRLREVAEQLGYGEMEVVFSVHDGKIKSGRVVAKRESLG